MSNPSKEPAGLRYIGAGAALPGFPARDLTAAEIAARADVLAEMGLADDTPDVRAWLLTTGLYAEPTEPTTDPIIPESEA